MVVEVAEPGQAVIVGVLTKEQIKEMKRMGEWPVEFAGEEEARIVRGLQVGDSEDGLDDEGLDSEDGLDDEGDLEDDSIVDEDTKDTNDTNDNEDAVN